MTPDWHADLGDDARRLRRDRITLAELVQLRALLVRLADTRRGDLADLEWDALATLRHTVAHLVADEQRRPQP